MSTETQLKNEPTAALQEHPATGFVTSKDGTTIGYYEVGRGPGIVLVQGAMGTAQNFAQLGEALADDFSVYTPDRRGRGLSGPGSSDYGVYKEVEDLEAVFARTGARYIFGLSSGALISLRALSRLSTIRKAVIYEPPLFVNGLPTALMAQYEQEISEGRLPAALVTAMKATQMGPRIFNIVPRWLLELLTQKAMESQDKTAKSGDVTMRTLAPTLHNDLQVVAEMHGTLDSLRSIHTDVLLLGGSQSPDFLKADLDALAKVLPKVRRIELRGVGHSAPWNFDKQTNPHGDPGMVAAELRRFFR